MFKLNKNKQLINMSYLRVLGCAPAANLHQKL